MEGSNTLGLPSPDISAEMAAAAPKIKQGESNSVSQVSTVISEGHKALPHARPLPTPPIDQQLARVIRELNVKSDDFTQKFEMVQGRIIQAIESNEISPLQQEKLVQDLTKKSNEHARAQIPSTIEEFSPPTPPHQNLLKMAILSKNLESLHQEFSQEGLNDLREKINSLKIDENDTLQISRIAKLRTQLIEIENQAKALSKTEFYDAASDSPTEEMSTSATTDTVEDWTYNEDDQTASSHDTHIIDNTTFETEESTTTVEVKEPVAPATEKGPPPKLNDLLPANKPAATESEASVPEPKKPLTGVLKKLENTALSKTLEPLRKNLLALARDETPKMTVEGKEIPITLNYLLQEITNLKVETDRTFLINAWNALVTHMSDTKPIAIETPIGAKAEKKQAPVLEHFQKKFNKLKASGIATKEDCANLERDIIKSQRTFLDKPAANRLIDEIKVFARTLEEPAASDKKSPLTTCVNYLKDLFGIGKASTIEPPSTSENKSFFSILGKRFLALFKRESSEKTEGAKEEVTTKEAKSTETEKSAILNHNKEQYDAFVAVTAKLKGKDNEGMCLIYTKGKFSAVKLDSADKNERLEAVRMGYQMIASALHSSAINSSTAINVKARIDGGVVTKMPNGAVVGNQPRLADLTLGDNLKAFEKIIKFHAEKEKATQQIGDIQSQNIFLRTNLEIIEKYTLSKIVSKLATLTLPQAEKDTLLDMIQNPKEGLSVGTYIKGLNISDTEKEALSKLAAGLELFRGTKVKLEKFESEYLQFIQTEDPDKAPQMGPLVQSQFKEAIESFFAEFGKDIFIEGTTIKDMFKANAAAAGDSKPIDWKFLSKQLQPQTLLRSTAGLQLLFQSPTMKASLKNACNEAEAPENFAFMQEYAAYLAKPTKEACEKLNKLIEPETSVVGFMDTDQPLRLNLPAAKNPYAQIQELLKDFENNKDAIGELLKTVFKEISATTINAVLTR
jgi:hypothetical protein